MAKLPAFMFYPGDWQKDPCLRRCSKAAKGAWMDMLCLLFECPSRGVFVDASGKPWSDHEIAEAIGGGIDANLGYIAELVSKGVAQRDTRGAIFSRRMVRDEHNRRSATERKRKERACHGRVTPLSVNESDTEKAKQKELFKEEKQNTSDVRSVVEDIGHLHPKNEHLSGRLIPEAQREVILDAIAKDGVDAVLSGTRSLAEKVAQWDPSELRFVPNPVTFYREGQYLKRPELWERKKQSGREECSIHPESGLTEWGTCWACYAESYGYKLG